MKYTTKWKWENTWSMYAFWVLLIFPWLIAYSVIPGLMDVYGQAGAKAVWWVILLGSLWGVGAITWGMGLASLGLAMGYSLTIGIVIVVGSLLPFVTEESAVFRSASGLTLTAGVIIICISILINAKSAMMREKDFNSEAGESKTKAKKIFVKGLCFCVFTGLVSPGLGYAYTYGGKLGLVQKAVDSGANDALAANVVLPLALIGGFFFNLIYTLYLVHKNKGWSLYFAKGTKRYYLYTMFFGIWTVGVALMGMGMVKLGDLGPSIGWAIINASAILTANVIGILTGEWKNASRKTMSVMVVGLIVLFAGICIVSYSTSLQG
jgi:L-rhamnose-H+ transport protein